MYALKIRYTNKTKHFIIITTSWGKAPIPGVGGKRLMLPVKDICFFMFKTVPPGKPLSLSGFVLHLRALISPSQVEGKLQERCRESLSASIQAFWLPSVRKVFSPGFRPTLIPATDSHSPHHRPRVKTLYLLGSKPGLLQSIHTVSLHHSFLQKKRNRPLGPGSILSRPLVA